MELSALPSQPRRLPLPALFAAAVAAQVLSILPLWSHQTPNSEVLGRYSSGYSAVLIANILLLLVTALAFLNRPDAETILNRFSFIQRWRIITFSAIALAVLWLLPAADNLIKEYLSLNWMLLTAILLYTSPDREVRRTWGWVYGMVLVLIFIPALITILTNNTFLTNESQWADYATSPFQASGLYSRAELQTPVTVTPGLGWSVAAYGWTLENVGLDVKIGRLWNLYFYILAFIGIGAVTWRLYGGRAAAISALFAFLSLTFLPLSGYQPDHQLPAAATLITFAALQARYSLNYRGFWDFVCGFAATLALQLHAAAIVFAFGFSLFYLAEFVLISVTRRKVVNVRPLLWFGLGALIGTALYFQFNIQPAGGLNAYLNALSTLYQTTTRNFAFLTWPSLFEGLFIVLALAFIAWRRSSADKLFLGILACVLIGILFFDPIGYTSVFNAFYIVPVGVLIADALPDPARREAKNLRAVTLGLGLLGIMAAHFAATSIDWSSINQIALKGEFLAFDYVDLRPKLLPYLQANDVVIGMPELIWTLPSNMQLVDYNAASEVQKRLNLTDMAQAWAQVKPTALIYINERTKLDLSLEDYLSSQHFIACKEIPFMNSLTLAVFRQTCPKPDTP